MHAIGSVGSVLAPYDTDQMYPCFGFGAKVPPHYQVSHCFALNGNEQSPEVVGVDVGYVCPLCIWNRYIPVHLCMLQSGHFRCLPVHFEPSPLAWANQLLLFLGSCHSNGQCSNVRAKPVLLHLTDHHCEYELYIYICICVIVYLYTRLCVCKYEYE